MDLLDDIIEGIEIAMRALIKALSGFIIIPLGIFIDNVKSDWEEAPKAVKYITGILLLPITGFLYFAAPWWDDFEIID